MKHITFIFAAMLMAFSPLYAQIQLTEPKPYIETNGYAEKEVVPDEIYISITLEEKNKTTLDELERKMKERLKAIGIDLTNLSLSDADASYIRVNWFSKDVVAKKNYQLKVADAATVSNVFKELGDLNIKNANVFKVDYSKKEALKKELRIAAVKNAKEQATYMLTAIDQKIGMPLAISENSGYPVMYEAANVRLYNKANADASGVPPAEDYMEFRKIKFTSNVNAKFEIK